MFADLKTALRPALTMTLLFALLLGIAYPLLMTAIGQTVFPRQANGSLIRDGSGRIVGSALIGQAFASPRYFHGRPSAAGTNGYDATASAGSNYGPASQALSDRVRGDVARLESMSPGQAVPADLVTASGSGLDPDISPEAAYYEVDRVASARHLDPVALHALVAAHIDRPLLGEAHVNLLALNRALDGRAPQS